MLEELTTTEIFPSATVIGVLLGFIGGVLAIGILIISLSIMIPKLKIPYLKKRFIEERQIFLIYTSIVTFICVGVSWFFFNWHYIKNAGEWISRITIIPPIYLIVFIIVSLIFINNIAIEFNIPFLEFFRYGNKPGRYIRMNPNDNKKSYLAELLHEMKEMREESEQISVE